MSDRLRYNHGPAGQLLRCGTLYGLYCLRCALTVKPNLVGRVKLRVGRRRENKQNGVTMRDARRIGAGVHCGNCLIGAGL